MNLKRYINITLSLHIFVSQIVTEFVKLFE